MAVQISTIYAIPPVQAGDLITAQYVNKLVAALLDLDARVRVLEERPQPGTGPASPPAGLAIASAVLTSIGQTTAINVVGSGLDPAGLNSYRINNIAFTPLGNVLGDDDEIVIAIPPTANAQILAAIENAWLQSFTLTLGATSGGTASASVGGITFEVREVSDLDFAFNRNFVTDAVTTVGNTAGGADVGTVVGNLAAGNFAASNLSVGPNFATLATQFMTDSGNNTDAPE